MYTHFGLFFHKNLINPLWNRVLTRMKIYNIALDKYKKIPLYEAIYDCTPKEMGKNVKMLLLLILQ